MDADASAPNDVFINCPYDPGYARTFEALVFVVHALGFRARAAREIDDGADVRIERIVRIIRECRYGIHDLSRAELDPNTGYARFNMPFELGVFLGAKRFGNTEQRKKSTLVLDIDPFRYRNFISDIAGNDPHAHGGEPVQAIRKVRDWLAECLWPKAAKCQPCRGTISAVSAGFARPGGIQGFDLNAIPYVDYLYFVTEWLTLDIGA